jgi:transcription initiation factor IIF auxiliary subunit
VDGPKDKLKDVDHVEYTLHPSFPNPVRTISTKGNKFKLKTGGWGVFPIYARIVTKDGRIETVEHDLKLHYPDGKPNTE